MTQNVSGTESFTNDINNNFAAAKTAIANCAPISLVQTVNGKADSNHTHSGMLTTSDIASTVNAQSTNAQTVGAKLFYDTVGNIETALNTINSGSNS